MHAFPLVRSQLVPPSVKSFLRRERLLNLGQAILSFRFTTVVAPAGYGKSVWAASLTGEPGWPATAWLSLDENDREPSCLLYHLIHAVQTLWPGFGSESLRTMNSLGNIHQDWPIAAAAFLEELPPEQELVLVLDDIHIVQESATNREIIEYFLRWLPVNKHLVMISRRQPPLNLSRCRMHGELLEINGGQLLFAPEESRNFFALLGLDLDEVSLAALQRATEGWAVCLRLAGTVLKQAGAQVDKTLQALEHRDSALHEYLGHELLAFLPEPLRGFLLDASLLPYLEEQLCNAAFQRQDSRLQMETLHAHGLLSLVEGEIVTWRLHHLIQEYLTGVLAGTCSQEHIAAVRSRACSFLEQRGEIDQAIGQAVAAADLTRATELICRHGHEYYTQSGRLDALYAWMERLPGDLVRDDPWLLYFKGKSIMQIDNGEAVSLLTDAAEKASQKGDLRCESYSLLALIYTKLETGGVKQSQFIMQRLLDNPLLMKDPASYGAALAVALGNAVLHDNVRNGLEYSRRALRLKLNPEVRLLVLIGSAVMQHRAGDLIKARSLLDEVLKMPFVQENERWSVIAYNILATVLNAIGDSQALESVCQKGLILTRKYRMLGDEGRMHRGLARMYLREGRLTEARREQEETVASFRDQDSIHNIAHQSMELALVRLHAGENARELLAEALELRRQMEGNPIGQGSDQIDLGIVGIIAIEAGELGYARELFEGLADHHRQNGTKYHLAGANLILSYIYLLLGKEREADRLLRQALSQAETGKYINFWEWHAEAIFTTCRRAVQKNIHAGWALRILGRWFPERIRHELGQFLVSDQESLRSFARSYLHDLRQETGQTIVHLFYLNGFRVFVDGCEVPNSAWKTQKAGNLLKLLAADPRKRHDKETIVEELWPESKSGDANLRMALSQVRKVLGSYGLTGESIVSQRKTLNLNPEIEWYPDFELFTSEAGQALHDGDVSYPRELSCLEQAARIYRGPFLPEDMYDAWTDSRRTRLQELYLRVLKRLAELYAGRNETAKAVAACNRYLEIEPADETIARMLMGLLASWGRRQKALSVYGTLVNILSRDYNITPENDTRDLYRKICSEKV